MPCRSGSPQGVFSVGAATFADPVGGSFWAIIFVGGKNTSTDTIATDVPTDLRSRVRILHLLLPGNRNSNATKSHATRASATKSSALLEPVGLRHSHRTLPKK